MFSTDIHGFANKFLEHGDKKQKKDLILMFMSVTTF